MPTTTDLRFTTSAIDYAREFGRITSNGEIFYNDCQGNLKRVLTDQLLKTNHIRFPKIMIDLKDRSFNFLRYFANEIIKFVYDRNTIYGNNVCFNLDCRYFDDIIKQMEDVKYRNIPILKIRDSFELEGITFKRCTKLLHYGSKQYDIMTDNTAYYWIPMIRKLEEKLETKNEI